MVTCEIMYEFWRPVRGHENYEVSNLGQVRRRKDRKLLRQSANRDGGYLRVALDRQKFCVHRLVAEAFFDSDPGKPVTHADGNKQNNMLPNLVYEVPQTSDTNENSWPNLT